MLIGSSSAISIRTVALPTGAVYNGIMKRHRSYGFEEVLGPEIVARYLQACRAQLERARELARRPPSLWERGALGELAAAAHKLAGSAGSYGFPEASRSARALSGLMSKHAAGSRPDAETRAQALLLIDELWTELGL